MTFGPTIRITSSRVESPLILGGMQPDEVAKAFPADLDNGDFPFIAPAFRDRITTLQTPEGCKTIDDDQSQLLWSIFVCNRLVGITGYKEVGALEGPESYTALADPEMRGKGVGGVVNQARLYHGLMMAGFESVRASVDVRNEASFSAVRRLGYVCLSHTTKDNERHRLIVHHPDVDASMSHLPNHGDSYSDARQRTALAMKEAERVVAYS